MKKTCKNCKHDNNGKECKRSKGVCVNSDTMINWEPIQEQPDTLEEAATRYMHDNDHEYGIHQAFIDGAQSDAARDMWIDKFIEAFKHESIHYTKEYIIKLLSI